MPIKVDVSQEKTADLFFTQLQVQLKYFTYTDLYSQYWGNIGTYCFITFSQK